MKVSVLINSRDRFEVLRHCLHSALTQDYPDVEVLVLDDGSAHYHLCQQLAELLPDPRLRCFRVETPLGVAGGRNFLMQQAAGDIFCVIDDDAVFADTQALRRFVTAFEQNPAVGILAAKIVDHKFEQARLLVPFTGYWRKKYPDLLHTSGLASYFLGGGHALRRQVIADCGYYSREFVFGEEELDLSYRAINQGYQIMYVPEVVVHHHPQPSLMGYPEHNLHSELFYHIRNRFMIAYKYLPARYIPIYLLIWLAMYGRDALRTGAIRDFIAGLAAGLRLLSSLQRTPLSKPAVQYLKANYGRLWY